MIKKLQPYLILFLLVVLFVGGLGIAWKGKSPPLGAERKSLVKKNRAPSSYGKNSSPPQNKENISVESTKRAEKKWQKNLESLIRAQGGEDVKSFTAESVGNFTYSYDGISLEVESLVITVKNHLDRKTTFRLLVDASSGKILQSWDSPIFDPANPREGFQVKIDPRYHELKK